MMCVEYSGVLETNYIQPGKAVYFAWQNPVKTRKLYWTTAEHVQYSNMLIEVISLLSTVCHSIDTEKKLVHKYQCDVHINTTAVS